MKKAIAAVALVSVIHTVEATVIEEDPAESMKHEMKQRVTENCNQTGRVEYLECAMEQQFAYMRLVVGTNTLPLEEYVGKLHVEMSRLSAKFNENNNRLRAEIDKLKAERLVIDISHLSTKVNEENYWFRTDIDELKRETEELRGN